MADSGLPQWMDQVDIGTIGVLTLDDGERLTAAVRHFDDEREELLVEAIVSNHKHRNDGEGKRVIPIRRVVSFEPQSRAEQPWPHSDPCRGTSFSFARSVLMTTLFLCAIVGSVPLFLLMKGPYGFQAASAIVYTISVVFLTFARTGSRGGKDVPPYLFTCPAVHPQLSRLLWRHFGFLIALFALQNLALAVRASLPDWWNAPDAKGGSAFELVLLFLCCGLGLAQVFSNRRLLDRAHREFPDRLSQAR